MKPDDNQEGEQWLKRRVPQLAVIRFHVVSDGEIMLFCVKCEFSMQQRFFFTGGIPSLLR